MYGLFESVLEKIVFFASIYYFANSKVALTRKALSFSGQKENGPIYWSDQFYNTINLSRHENKYTYENKHTSSVILWQKGGSQNGGNKNTKHANFYEKQTFFTS